MTSRKLLRVERSIHVYDSGNKLIREISVDVIPFEQIKGIVPPNQDDPLMYDGYELNESQLSNFQTFLSERIMVDFSSYFYVLICLGIYE